MNIDRAMQLKEVKLLNKQNHIFSNILVFIVCYVCIKKFQRMHGYILLSLLNLQISQVLQGSYSSPILNYAFDFWLAEEHFEPSWKSIPAKTGTARLVPPPLITPTYVLLLTVYILLYSWKILGAAVFVVKLISFSRFTYTVCDITKFTYCFLYNCKNIVIVINYKSFFLN